MCDIRRGVAARALHLSRGVEKPSGRVTYTVVLEGLCRFSVLELNSRGTYYTARISPLDITKAGELSIFFCLKQACISVCVMEDICLSVSDFGGISWMFYG